MNNIKEIIKYIEANNLCLVIVTKKTCARCSPVVDQVEKMLCHLPTLQYTRVSLDEVPAFSGQYMVFSVPTILLFFRGKEVLRQSGFIHFDQLKADIKLWIDHFSSLDSDPFSALYE